MTRRDLGRAGVAGAVGRRAVGLGQGLLLLAATLGGASAGVPDAPPADTEALDPAALEARLAEAPPRDPAAAVAAAVALAGFSRDAASLALKARFAGPEGTGPLTVEAVVDGLLDDSVRAMWWRLVLKRDDEGIWRIVAAERAWRCRRADQGFGAALCP